MAIGSVTFAQPIVGVIGHEEHLTATDGVCGLQGTEYAPDSGRGRGFEDPPDPNADQVALSGDRHTVLMALRTDKQFCDQMRIFTLSKE